MKKKTQDIGHVTEEEAEEEQKAEEQKAEEEEAEEEEAEEEEAEEAGVEKARAAPFRVNRQEQDPSPSKEISVNWPDLNTEYLQSFTIVHLLLLRERDGLLLGSVKQNLSRFNVHHLFIHAELIKIILLPSVSH